MMKVIDILPDLYYLELTFIFSSTFLKLSNPLALKTPMSADSFFFFFPTSVSTFSFYFLGFSSFSNQENHMNIFLHPPKHSPLCPRCRSSEESSRKKETWIVSCQGRGCTAERSAAKSRHPFPCPCFVLTSSCILHSVSGESLTTYPHPLQKAPPQMLVSPK